MHFRLLITMFAALSGTVVAAYSQTSDENRWESVLETLLSDEDLSSDAREELSFMYESMHESPLNINTATREELAQLPFLTFKQITKIPCFLSSMVNFCVSSTVSTTIASP